MNTFSPDVATKRYGQPAAALHLQFVFLVPVKGKEMYLDSLLKEKEMYLDLLLKFVS